MTDLHSHILPNIDDGSSSVDESLEMLKALKNQGITRVYLTPHFYPADNIESFLQKRDEMFGLLSSKLNNDDYPEIRKGAEIFFFDGMCYSEEIFKLKLDGTDAILLEMPFETFTESMYEEIRNIYEYLNLDIILAHVERYLSCNRLNQLLKLKYYNVMFQVNSSFFTSAKTRQKALKMLKKGYIDCLGSDSHNMTSRAPDMGDAVNIICERLDREFLENLNMGF